MSGGVGMRPGALALCLGAAAGAAQAQDSTGARLVEDLMAIVEYAPITAEVSAFYHRDPFPGDDRALGFARLSAEFAGPVLDSWEIRFTPEFNADTGDRAGSGFRIDERGRRRPALGAEEAWVSRVEGPWTVTLGKQIFSWGAADLYSPTDDLNARDKLDLPDTEKLGAPALSVGYATQDVGLQFVFVPWFTPDRLPPQDNRWSRSTDPLADAAALTLGFRPVVSVGPRDLPGAGLDSSTFGARVASSTLAPGWDLSATAVHGPATNPVVAQTLNGGTLELVSVYSHYTELGGGFSTIAGDYEVHGEASLHLTREGRQDDDYVTAVIGFRRDWLDDPLPQVEEVRLTAEYAMEHVTRRAPVTNAFVQTAFDRSLANSVLGKLEVKFDEDTTATASGAVNLEDRDWTLDLNLTHDFDDQVTVAVGVQIFEGPSDSFFGAYSGSDRIYSSIEIVF
ncbi:hypothetical protein P2H44_25205 [Albimonas sp. CAU 1670]|uniref:hypothetical protein n=1 Tax=Albimonas sp. CAU 1670 TaxID=3032599 RepID=UPI0023DB58C3|nr:hypothetical protein [Albimonas sp. CAU 1670]MDF2235864.1 hypothetical protein [Albimonas sp. CAU 1670]